MLPGHRHSRSQPSTPLRSPLPSSQGLMGLDVTGELLEARGMRCSQQYAGLWFSLASLVTAMMSDASRFLLDSHQPML
jgi:23S rRNA G2445 N2-methylase RlmL